MSSMRVDQWIDAPAEAVWRLVADSTRVPEWFTGIESCVVNGDRRVCSVKGGAEFVEEIVLTDPETRRFQYRVLEGLPATQHLGTIDVIADTEDRCLVVYSTEVLPDSLAPALRRSTERALGTLAQLFQ